MIVSVNGFLFCKMNLIPVFFTNPGSNLFIQDNCRRFLFYTLCELHAYKIKEKKENIFLIKRLSTKAGKLFRKQKEHVPVLQIPPVIDTFANDTEIYKGKTDINTG
jgi:hypothetical protein